MDAGKIARRTLAMVCVALSIACLAAMHFKLKEALPVAWPIVASLIAAFGWAMAGEWLWRRR